MGVIILKTNIETWNSKEKEKKKMKRTISRNFWMSIVGLLISMPAFATTNMSFDDTRSSVFSDGNGAYINGKTGVSAVIDNVGDFIMSFASTSTRAFNIDLRNPVDPLNAPASGVQTCNASQQSSISIRDLLTIPVGTTASRRGFIQIQLHFANGSGFAYTENWNQADDPVQLFSVTRTSKNQWIVQSANAVDGDVSSYRLYSLPSNYPAGAWTFVSAAHYHTPIYLTINK